jgi:hypothetical protein
MIQTEKGTYTAYVPAHGTVKDETFGTTHLMINVSHDKDRKRFYLAAVPVSREAAVTQGIAGAEQVLVMHFQFETLAERVPRFNAKQLADHAANVDRHLKNPSDRDTPVWKLIERMLRDNHLALTTPATGKPREQVIDEIVTASRMPCPNIVERNSLLCEDGNYYFGSGIPASTRAVEPFQTRSEGFAYADRNGVTHGTRENTEELLRQRWETSQSHSAELFRAQLEAMNDTELEKQALYWLGWLQDDTNLIPRAA